jgi:hypothetical protein
MANAVMERLAQTAHLVFLKGGGYHGDGLKDTG